MDLHDPFVFLILESRLGRDAAATYLGVSRRTIDRWIKADSAPIAARRALAWLCGRADDWRGFCFRGPTVTTPAGDQIHRNQIDSLRWQFYLHREMGKETIRAQIGKGRQQPAAPGEVVQFEQVI